MGYRLRLGKVTKEDWNKLYKDKTQEDIIKQFGNGDNDNYFAFAYPPQHIQLYELGKYVDFKNDEFTPFYSFELDDSEFWIVSKKGLLSIIEQYRQDTQKYYQKLIKSFENKTEDMHEKIISHFIYKNNIWNNKFEELHPYYLDQKKTDGFIVNSWDKEYAIFNLVYIYRTFDFENELLIYSGW